MPHPKGHLKLSGDVHLPDAESDLPLEEGGSGLASLAKERRQPRGAATRVRHAGVLRAGDGDQGRPAQDTSGGAPTETAGAAAQDAQRPDQPASRSGPDGPAP
jgi:hypothetical protein